MKNNVRLLTWFNFILGINFLSAVAIIYFIKVSGSYTLGLSIFSISIVSSAIFEIPTGVFSDHIGRRKTVIYGALFSLVSSLLLVLAPDYTILVISAIFGGLARSFYSGNNEALLHESLTETNQVEEYAQHRGRMGSFEHIATAITAFIGALIASYSFALVLWISVIPPIMGLVISLLLVEPSVHTKESGNVFNHLKEATTSFFRNERIRLLSTGGTINYAFSEAAFQFESAFFNTLLPLSGLGVIRALQNVFAVVSYWFSGAIIKRLGVIQTIVVGSTYGRFITIIGALFPTIASPFLISTASLSHGSGIIAQSTLMQEQFSEKQRATMGSLNSLLGSLLFGVAAYFIGIVADLYSPATALIVCQVIMLPVAFIYLKVFKKNKQLTS